MSEEECQAALEKSMVLFSVLNEKDTYEAFYKKYLARRLLYGKSANTETERSMISRLKVECGANYTAKLEGAILTRPSLYLTESGMFTDMDISRDVMTSYSNSIGENGKGEVDFSVQVLSSGYWPSPPQDEPIIPSNLNQHLKRFQDFYSEKYQGRRLGWSHNLDKCIVAARFPKGKKELEVSLYQALVLQCFNLDSKGEEKALTLKDILVATNIDVEEVRRTLISLACGEIGTRVLTKEPKGKDVTDSDIFRFNTEFSSKLFRIKIRTIAVKETEADVIQTNEEVFRDRQYAVDANIVRIMKARKQLSHNMLLGEILSQLKFPVSNADIKRRIESLIEREYLERDRNDQSTYRYLA